jgi:hypothetical protein
MVLGAQRQQPMRRLSSPCALFEASIAEILLDHGMLAAPYRLRSAGGTAVKVLDDLGQPKIVLEVIAQRIIQTARRGERDPARSVEAALPWFTRDRG